VRIRQKRIKERRQGSRALPEKIWTFAPYAIKGYYFS
jgi:hypothetical protein